MPEGPSDLIEQDMDSEGEEEISGVETDILFEAHKLAMERDEEPEDPHEDSGEDSDIDEGQDDGNESDYIPSNIRGSRRHPGTSRKHAGASNLPKTFMRNQGTKDSYDRGRQKKKNLTYEFCPLQHRPLILHLLTKHFCLHPLLPERHGEPRTADDIYSDSVHEMYLHCKNNHLREVWAYLWTNWYSPDKWKIWARSTHPQAISRRRTTMVVEAMWRNFKRLVLYLHNRPRVDFATFALVTQALPAYRFKLLKVMDDPRKGRAGSLTGEQIPIKKAWLALYDREANGHYDTNELLWTCSCGHQKYHSYLLCKHLVQKFPRPEADWWTTVIRYHTPPFYDIRAFLSAEEQARAPEPEKLGNRAWLARMPDMPVGASAPAVSPLPVRIVYL